MAQDPYVHVTRLKLDFPLHDKLTMDLDRVAARQLNDLLARALNCLPENEWATWYALADKLDAFVKEIPLAPQQEQGEMF